VIAMTLAKRCGCLIFAGILVAQQERSSGAAVSRGKGLFEQCRGCHSSETDEKKAAPSLKGLFKRTRLRNGQPVNEKTIREKIDRGGDGMPAYSQTLSVDEKNDLITYLKAL
jgi:mono/diheme cytochrome c family protein